MKQKQDKSILYIVSTLAFILLGIMLTGIINKIKSNDVRARASATSGIQATATVYSIDSNTIVVSNLAFTSSPEKNLGSWTVTPPNNFSSSSISMGSTVHLTIEPTSFLVTLHTLTAKEIKKK